MLNESYQKLIKFNEEPSQLLHHKVLWLWSQPEPVNRDGDDDEDDGDTMKMRRMWNTEGAEEKEV